MQVAVRINPAETLHVADKNLVSIKVDLLPAEANDSALLKCLRCLTNLDTTLMECPANVQDPVLFGANDDGLRRYVIAAIENPLRRLTKTVVMVVCGALFSCVKPVGEGPGLCFFLVLILFVFSIGEISCA